MSMNMNSEKRITMIKEMNTIKSVERVSIRFIMKRCDSNLDWITLEEIKQLLI